LLLSLFLDIINPFSGEKKGESCYLSIEYFLGIFGARLIFIKNMEAVTSSEEASEASIVHNEGSAQIDNTH
jgi:hypothetical protein